MVFDTNVLVHAAREDSDFHDPCWQRVMEARTGVSPAFITWSICYEFLRVITHPRVYDHPWTLNEGCRFLEMLLESPSFDPLLPTRRHLYVLAEIALELPTIRGNLVHDLHTAVLMREHGISQICTMDSDFRRFPFLEVVDPLH